MKIKLTRNRIIELTLMCTLLLLYLTRHWFGIGSWRAVVLILIFSVPIVYIKFSKRSLKEIFLSKKNLKKSLFYGLIGSIVLISINTVILHHVFGGFYLMPELKEFGWWFPLAIFLGTQLPTGAGEEVLFRGFLQSHLRNYFPKFWVVLTQAIIFVLLHPRYYIGGPYYISFSVFMFGIVAGFIALKTENLSGPILMHGLFNTVGVMLFFVPPIAPSA